MTEDNRINNPEVSVVIPFYKEVGWLCEAVDSVLSQDRGDYEIIVVNDGSPEDVTAFLERYGDKIVYIEQENAGPAAARNRGLSEAKGEYIAFLDSDDLWTPEKLFCQVAKMREYDAVWSLSDYETFGEGLPTKTVEMYTERTEGIRQRFSMLIGTPTVMVSRAFLNDNGLSFRKDLRYGQDAMLWEEINSRAPVLYLPKVLARVRMRGANAAKRAAVQIHARVHIYDKCCECIPGYKKSKTLLYRFAMALCRFGGIFVNEKSKGKGTELLARILFAFPYLLFKIDRKRSDAR